MGAAGEECQPIVTDGGWRTAVLAAAVRTLTSRAGLKALRVFTGAPLRGGGGGGGLKRGGGAWLTPTPHALLGVGPVMGPPPPPPPSHFKKAHLPLTHRLDRLAQPPPPPLFPHSVGLLFLHGALDSHQFFPSHIASGRCVLSAAAGVPCGRVSALAEPSRWCTGGLCWSLRGSFYGL